jgi:hypothetical protein
VVYLLALTAALVNAVSSILQRLGVEGAPTRDGAARGLVGHMVRRAVWLWGFALMGAGFVAQAAALHLGTLAVVQPLLVAELVFVVLALWAWYAQPVGRRDLLGVVAVAGGLAGFLTVAAPVAGTRSPPPAAWALAGAVALALALAAIAVARRGPPWWRALWLGAAASVGFALTAALTKTATGLLASGWGPLVTHWPLYALAVVGLGSFLLMQHAFHAGPFAASQSTLIVVNPFASIALGATLFADRVHDSPGALAAEALALAVLIVGAVVLSSSALIVGVHDEDPSLSRLVGRGRLARWRARP